MIMCALQFREERQYSAQIEIQEGLCIAVRHEDPTVKTLDYTPFVPLANGKACVVSHNAIAFVLPRLGLKPLYMSSHLR